MLVAKRMYTKHSAYLLLACRASRSSSSGAADAMFQSRSSSVDVACACVEVVFNFAETSLICAVRPDTMST